VGKLRDGLLLILDLSKTLTSDEQRRLQRTFTSEGA
jgi:hypothetical protein